MVIVIQKLQMEKEYKYKRNQNKVEKELFFF